MQKSVHTLRPKIKLLNNNPHIVHHLAAFIFITLLLEVAGDEEFGARLGIIGDDLAELAPSDTSVEAGYFLCALIDIVCDEYGTPRIVILQRLKLGLPDEPAVNHNFVHYYINDRVAPV